MPPIVDKGESLAKEFLGASEAEWEDLRDRSLSVPIRELATLLVELQDELEESQKFWNMIKEDSLLPKIDKQLNLLDRIRAASVEAVTDPSADDTGVRDKVMLVSTNVKKSYKLYTKAEEKTINLSKENSIKRPKTSSLIQGMRAYWRYIDDFWSDIRAEVIGEWDSYFDKSNLLLRRSLDRLSPKKSTQASLLKVSHLLRKRASHFAAQKVDDAIDRIKNYEVEDAGLIPAYVGARGDWKVACDDCPDLSLPEHTTRVTDHFAFCMFSRRKKKCPSFVRSQGSYVRCKSFTTLKKANLVTDIKKISSEKFLKSLDRIAETDPFVRKLFIESDRRSGSLYYGKSTDSRLNELLEGYPRSDRRGTYNYRVYTIADEPVLVIGKYVVAADVVLLETIGKGDQMPREASVQKTAEAVIRLTFTANAVRDPEFRAFIRKHKGVKSKHFSYDIPFDTEEDIKFILQEIHEEFGYKVEVFELLEDNDSPIERDFGVYNLHSFPISKFSERIAMTYIPRASKTFEAKVSRPKAYPDVAKKLSEVSGSLEGSNLLSRVKTLSKRLRVGAVLLVASKRDVVRYPSGAIGVLPDIGTRWASRDPETGEAATVELMKVTGRKKSQTASHIEYTVRRTDTGKEFKIKSAWLTEADCGGNSTEEGALESRLIKNLVTPPAAQDPSPYDALPSWARPAPEPSSPAHSAPPMPMAPAPEIPPEESAFKYLKGKDSTVFLVKLPPKGPSKEAPQEFGRFPGDLEVSMPEPTGTLPMGPPPMMDGPMGPPPMMDGPMMDGPMMDGPMGPPMRIGPPAREEHGPAVDSKDTYVALDTPPSASPPDTEVLDDVKKKTAPGLKFKGKKSPIEEHPAGNEENEISDAVSKLKKKLRGDPRVKGIRKSLSPKGKPVLYVHSTMPKTLRKELESSINGFEVITAPVHEEDKDAQDMTADSLVNPMKEQPSNGKPTHPLEPQPATDQVGGGPPVRDTGISVNRDYPPGS